ncbi:MAG: universal stress protein [Treponema sp.]
MIRPLFQNILVLVRGGEGCVEAAQYATVMSKLYRSKVHALYVVDTASIKKLSLNKIFVAEESQEYERNMEETGGRYLEHIREIGASKGVEIKVELCKGSVSEEIGNYVEQHKIDAVLVGVEDGTRNEIFERSFYSIISHLKCSVIIVKDKLIKNIYKMA